MSKDTYAIVNKKTGEVLIDDFEIDTLEKRKEKKKIYDTKKEFTDFQLFQKELSGTYIQNYFNRFLKLNVESQYMFRFLYLCTFANYQDNILKVGTTKNRRKMTFKDLEKILNVSSKEFYNTRNLLIDKGLIKIDLDSIIVNKKIAIRGEIRIRKGVYFVKAYDEAIKELYENASAKEHKKLGYLIQLLPFVNVFHNVICSKETIETQNIDEVEALSFKDICEVIGYSAKNSSRLEKDLLMIKVKNESAIMIHQHFLNKFITINPRIFYRGNNIEDLKALSNLFRIKNRK